MTYKKTVAVIGGGVSGLAAARAFSAQGHRVLGYERSHDFGGVWELSRSYPDVQTQSPKDLYCFTDHPMPADYPEWPTGPQVHAYLHSYAVKHDLVRLFTLNTRVLSMDRRSDCKSGWTLKLANGEKVQHQDVDFVVVCTGQFSDKSMVTHPGQEEFIAQGGQVIHSSDYTDPELIRGKRVVVLGGSKSATDIAVSASQRGAASVTLVYRRNVWRVPYFVGGINFKRLLYMRAQEVQFNGWDRTIFERVIARLAKPLVWANFRALETLLKLQLGLKRWDMVPETPIEQEASCSLPLVTPGLFECFKSGSIRPIRSSFERYRADAVVLESGEQVGCDVAIQAVGWNLGVPYLPQEYRAKLIEEDGQYRTYRFAVNPDLPDMGFVGFNSSFCTVLSSEMIAHWLVRYMDGKLQRQPTRIEMERNITAMLHWRRTERPAAKVYGGLCAAPFHFRHFDELLADIGATQTKRANPLAEQFSYPDAASFGKYLATAPKYDLA